MTARREGMPHLVAIVGGLLALAIGGILLIGPFFTEGVQHSNVRDGIGAVLLAFAAICFLPAKVDKAADVFRKATRRNRRSSDNEREIV